MTKAGAPMISDAARRAIRQLRKTPPFGADGFDLGPLRRIMSARRDPADASVRCAAWRRGGMSGHWVLAEGADPDVRVLYLHGGGYVSGCGAYYLALAARLAVTANCAVCLPDYRLAPEHPFPAGLEDALAACDWLSRAGPDGPALAKAVLVAGDSAGGGLALAVLLALRDRRRRLPAGGVALSPFTDLTLSSESIRTQADNDVVQHPTSLPHYVRLYLHGTDPRDPLASPVFGDYTHLPPLLIQVGECEIIRDDAVRAAAKARTDGADVTLEVWPGMFHVFQAHEPPLPETREAIERIADFIRRLVVT